MLLHCASSAAAFSFLAVGIGATEGGWPSYPSGPSLALLGRASSDGEVNPCADRALRAFPPATSCEAELELLHERAVARNGGAPFRAMVLVGDLVNKGPKSADKVINMVLDVAEFDWVAAVLPVQFDEMVRDETERLVRNVERVTGLWRRCEADPPQPDRRPRPLPTDFVEWMNEFVDWNVEALIGFDSC